MGVEPSQVADLLALKGDAVDNIPGAPGIGEKGARDLLAQFGSVPAALDRAAEVTKRMARESLQNNRERIEMSLRLATIHCDVPIPFELDALQVQEPETESLKTLYKELEFFSHLKELGPSEDVRPRISRLSNTAEAVRAFIAIGSAGRRSVASRFRPIRTKSVSPCGQARPVVFRPCGCVNLISR